MAKKSIYINLGSSTRTYLTAAALLVSAVLFILIAYRVFSASNQSSGEAFFPLAAMSFGLIWILTERLLKRTVFGVTLTTAWQDRLTFAIPVGFVISVNMVRGINDYWAMASQLIGGWVIFGCAAVLVNLLWSGIKASFLSSKRKKGL